MENINPVGVRKGMWTPQEDILLRRCIDNYGEGKWHLVPLRAGLKRCRKSCRLRWLNYLKPTIKRGQFTKDEVDLIIRLHKLLGNRWTLIAGRLPGRTANDVKNFWNGHIDKKLPPEETFSGRARAHKAITQSNIVRPRPRTFPDVHLRGPKETTPPDQQAIKKNNLEIASSSSHEADECIRWWTSLLQLSAQDDQTDMVAGLVDDDHRPDPIGQGGYGVDDGFGELSVGVDVGELLSFGDEI